MSIVLKADGVSKMYRLGLTGTSTVADDLRRTWAKVLGKEDPFAKIGEVNDRTSKGSSDYVWALKDVSFSLEKGDVLGVIGKNGAGKSTLLKILSRVTLPTSGTLKARGRIASLLEVGTGFHPELSGRDNIYLNGTILGMTRAEITRKFDEIVDFSGVERYIDTPVKRYSSGMYVRLAFAVAAHLEPEIMIVDEVLAVGDSEFQKKCLGKMNAVSKEEGRTILFVSHNMGAIQELCNKAMLMHHGTVREFGSTPSIITTYLNTFRSRNFDVSLAEHTDREGNGDVRFTSFEIRNEQGAIIESLLSGQTGEFVLGFKVKHPQETNTFHFSLRLTDDHDNTIFHLSPTVANGSEFKLETSMMEGKAICRFYDLPLQPGIYYVHLFCSNLQQVFDHVSYAAQIEIEAGNFFGTGKLPPFGNMLVHHKWQLENNTREIPG